jgi:hypothetical protein
MARFLRSVAAVSAFAGAVLLVVGFLEHEGASGMGGLATVAIGVVMIVGALAALAPISTAPEATRESRGASRPEADVATDPPAARARGAR